MDLSDEEQLNLKLQDDDAEVIDHFSCSSDFEMESDAEVAPNDADAARNDADTAAEADDEVLSKPHHPPEDSACTTVALVTPKKPKRPAVKLTEANEKIVAQWLETYGEFIYNKSH